MLDFSNIWLQLQEILFSNKLIWTPVLTAWAVGFIYTRHLNSINFKRKSDREFKIYRINAAIAFFLYGVFHFNDGMEALQEATLAGAVAVLLPAAWFWYQSKKSV